MNGPIPSSIIQMAQQFYQQVAGATGNGPITLNLHNKRKQGFTYNMSAQDVEQLVTDRLSKLNLSLETLKTEPDWNGKYITYQGLRMETLPNMRKQYCYARYGWFTGELILGLSLDPKRPCMIACNLDNVETEFMYEGNIKASSTYIKVPLSYRLFRDNELNDFEDRYESNDAQILSTPEAINEWFDKFEAYLPRVVAQGKMCADVLAYIKTNGKPFKDTMKQYNKRDKEWKDARKNYEDMIIQQIARITKLYQVNDDF